MSMSIFYMKVMSMKKHLVLLAAACSAVCLTGCKFFWEPKDALSSVAQGDDATNPVVIKIDGRPVMRKAELLEFAEQAMKANPYLSSFGITSFETAPEPIRQQIVDAMVQQKLVTCWAQEKGVQNSAEYKEAYAKIVDQVGQALLAQTFDKEIIDTVSVSESEVADKYDAMKEEMIKEPSVVKVVGASFKNEEKANVFYDLVAKKEEDSFVNLAKESKVDVQTFEPFSLDMRKKAEDVPAAVRKAVVQLGKHEFFTQAKDGDSFWVVQVVDRSEPVYASLPEVAEQLSAMVKQEKFRVVRDERINAIRSLHTVDVDQSVLGQGQDPFAALQAMLGGKGGLTPEMMEAMAAAELEGEDASAESEESGDEANAEEMSLTHSL